MIDIHIQCDECSGRLDVGDNAVCTPCYGSICNDRDSVDDENEKLKEILSEFLNATGIELPLLQKKYEGVV